MRICHITRYFQPGMGYQENGLLAAQMRLGHDVMLIASDRYHPHPNYKETMKMTDDARMVGPGRRQEDGLDVVRLKVVWEWPAHWWVVWGGLWNAVNEFRPDIIHTHCAVIASSTFQILWGNLFRRYPIVVDDHNNYFNIQPYTPSKKFLYRFLFRRLMRPVLMSSVGRVLPISHEVQEYLDRELGIRPERTTISTLGTDPSRFHRDPEAGRRVRAELGIPADAVVIVNAGKITRTKDNHVLLEAMGQVRRQNDRAFLVMVGNAPREYRRELEALIEKHGLAPHLRWLDFMPNKDLPALYSASDIGVWPGDASITDLECASCGVPLVLPRCGYNFYAMANNNGLFFERGDAESLAGALHTLITDDARRAELGRNARQLIERDLNWDSLARQTVEIYQSVLDARHKSSRPAAATT